MSDCWYFANEDDEPVGPFKLAKLQALLKHVPNWEESMVWGIGLSQWQRAGSVSEFSALFEAPPQIHAINKFEPLKDQTRKSRGRTVARISVGMAFLVAAAAGGAFGQLMFKGVHEFLTTPLPSPTALDVEKGFASALDKLRIDLPRKIDATTMLTGIRNEGTRVIFENLILVDVKKFDDAMKEKLRESIIKNVCGSPETRRILEIGGSFRYLYANTEAMRVMTIDIVQRSCP